MNNAFDDQRLSRALKENSNLYVALRDMLVQRREQRREQAENAQGELAVALRGRCQELTAIINEFFKEVTR
jgi:hypothetical protein